MNNISCLVKLHSALSQAVKEEGKNMLNLGLLILRLALGLTFIGHGGQKLFGWFGGQGLPGTNAMMERLGFRPTWFWGLLAALSEFGGGVLLALGLLAPLGSLGIMAAMMVAITRVHWLKGFWNSKGGFEFPLINLSSALALAVIGPGAYSLDAILGISLPEPGTLLIGVILIILGFFIGQTVHSHIQVKKQGGHLNVR
jgi:putative oxidoreductase